jgi:hypothetical protein
MKLANDVSLELVRTFATHYNTKDSRVLDLFAPEAVFSLLV